MRDHSMAFLLGEHNQRIATLEASVGKIKTEVEMLRAWGSRLAILLTLWTAGASAHLGSDAIAEIIARIIKAALTKS